MAENKTKKFIKHILLSIILTLLGSCIIVFSSLTLDAFNIKVIQDNYQLFMGLIVALTSLAIILALCFFGLKQEFIYKLSILTIAIIFIGVILIYLLKKFGVLDNFSTVEDFRIYISEQGSFAVFVFIAIQLLQVVVLPIPSFVTVGAGVLLFGPFKSAVFSLIGIILGSFIAFFIGKKIGFKAVRWLVGEKALNKGLALIKGKDKAILTFMFLFPLFPDDLLCFVSGITGMTTRFFISMITIVRIITVFVSCYTLNNSIIPYDTWWGILVWAIIFIAFMLVYFLITKKLSKKPQKQEKNK